MHSHAKIFPPRLEGVCNRGRLFTRIDEARNHSVVWVSGSGGSGKTTLAASYAATRGLRTVWLQLDASDADPATFFHYLGVALKKALPRTRPLPALTPEYLADPAAFARSFFGGLSQRLKGPALVVLDNYQNIPEDSAVHTLLAAGQEELGSQQSLLVLSRNLPPAVFARVRACGRLVLIEQDELALTEAESGAVVDQMCPTGACDSLRDRLYTLTGGWAAGLVLMLQKLDVHHPENLADSSTAAVFDYFASELFEGVGDELRAFLLKTALLPNFTAAMARKLTGSPDAARMLDSLLRRNLFITRRGSGELVNYQYHDLFRDFLLAQGRREIGFSVYMELRKRAADLLIGNGQHEAAVELLVAAGEGDALATLIETQAGELARRGRLPTLERWLGLLPSKAFEGKPWLRYWTGICRLPFDPIVARDHLRGALDRFEAQADAQGALLAWVSAVDTFPQAMDPAYELDRYLDRLDGLVARFSPLERSIELQLAPRVLACLLVRRPGDPAFEHWRKLAYEALNDPGVEPGLRLLSGYHLVGSHIWAGDPIHAHHVVAMLKSMSRSDQGAHSLRLTAMMVESWVAALSAQREESFDAMEEALALANESGVHLWDSMLLLIGATVAEIRGELEIAGLQLGRLEAQLGRLRPLDQLYFFHQRAWLALLQGDPVRALADQRKALDIAVRLGMKFPLADAHVGMMWAMHAVKDRAGTVHYFGEAERLAKELHSVYLEFMLRFARAVFGLDGEDRNERVERVGTLMKLGREHGITGMTWWQPRLAARLCAVALEEGIEVEYAYHLIRLHGLVPDDAAAATGAWPYPVHLRTLGEFSLTVDNQPLRTGGKAQKKPLELLATLVALGPLGVSEDRLVDALWPETDLAQARQNLKVTLHRLRRLVGMRAVRVEGGKLSLDSRYIWVDALAFMQVDRDIEAGLSAGHEVSSQLLDHLLTTYRGEFLPDEYGVWALPMREGLRARVLRILEQVGGRLLQEGRYAEAGGCFERGIQIDPYAEEFYRGLMQSYHRLGRLAEVRRVYERCERLLREVLGVACSPDTEALYRAVGLTHDRVD